MNLILGGGFYRLDLNLREGKGWTYGARSTFDSRSDARARSRRAASSSPSTPPIRSARS